MNTNFICRKAQREDIEELALLLHELFSIEVDFTPNSSLQQKGLELFFHAPQSQIIVAERNSQIVGMVSGQLTISTAEGANGLLIEDLIVSAPHRGLGIGRALLERIGHWGASHGARRMQLLADIENHAALDFYTHEKWQRTNLFCLRKYHQG